MQEYYQIGDTKIKVIFVKATPTKEETEELDIFMEGAEKNNLVDCINCIVVENDSLCVNFLGRIYVEFKVDEESGVVKTITSFEGI